MIEINKIDDKFFKKIIESKKNTRDFLKKVLPKGIKKHLDFSRIHIDRTNYVSNEFKEGYADFTVKIKMKTKKGKKNPVDIYFIIEHKSKGEKELLLQILKYMYFVWEKDILNKKPLRIIIPVVFYHGKGKWKVPEAFVDQFDVDEEIKKHLLNYRYILFDTNKWDLADESNKELIENVHLFSAMALMKASFKKDLQIILDILKLWHEKGFTRERRNMLFFLKYISQTQEIRFERLEKMLKESKINGGDIMQTLAQQLREEGIKIGEEKGKEEKAKETAKKMLEKGFDLDTIVDVTGLHPSDIERLREVFS
ncbi:MAG: Rpn family recombination-promoting nuclease/putative transposase [Candidatus Aminicenantes bacterium]|nr:MAG: Rpn family recombination-promoting nuclease/putative transposase [Candidatus Aminicenantes bacterium]